MSVGDLSPEVSLPLVNRLVYGFLDKHLSEFAMENNIGGFEFLSCIPGSIGGGIIQGTPMSGGRTGYWKPWKKAKKFVKKLIPKELAGAMQVAAPFMPAQFGIPMAALGSYKQKG